jgi:hypothetical protein
MIAITPEPMAGNQVKLGVLSRSMLRKLVKGGGPEQQPALILCCEGER